MRVYLDNSATTRPSERVVAAMMKSMEEGFYNPSSLYRSGLEAQKRMEACRCLLGTDKQVVFTASGTEADNLAIIGHCASIKKRGRVLYTAVEHPAVKQACVSLNRYGHTAEAIPVTTQGVIDLQALEKMLDENVIMLCVMQVNNETGSIMPIRAVADLRDRLAPQAALHVDGVQGFLRIPFDMGKCGVQSYALSAHKVHGPKGVGALVAEKGFKISPLIFGGGQEKNLRSGTENTSGIAGFHEAIASYKKEVSENMRRLKILLHDLVREAIPSACVNGFDPRDERAAPHILNMSFSPVRSDTMLFALEGSGILVSSGSACSSSKQKVSETLAAMKVQKKEAECAIRFSLSMDTTEAEIRYTADEIKKHYDLLSKYTRR